MSGYGKQDKTLTTKESKNNTRSALRLATFFSRRHRCHSREIFKRLCEQLASDSRTLGVSIATKFLRNTIALDNPVNQ